MRVIGTPAFDWHFRKDLLKSREEFCKDIGIDPAKKIILFGAMEYYWYPRDADIARIFDDVVASGKISKDAVMLFRPHPGYEGPIERVKALETQYQKHHSQIIMLNEKISGLLQTIAQLKDALND